MPGRKIPLVNEQIYHVFNRGIDRRPTFISTKEYTRAITVIDYYRFSMPPTRLSYFLKLSKERRQEIYDLMSTHEKLVDILAYCLMPNHFHFMLRQLADNGISKFLSNFQNSYTRYFNTIHERTGSLFLDQFKGVLIETDEQLVHVSRYIHLNPLTSYVVRSIKNLLIYPWSSLNEYVENNPQLCELETVLQFFKKPNEYLSFVKDQMNYQRELHKIQHLVLE